MKDTSKVKRFAVSDIALLAMFQTGKETCIHVDAGFPDDSQILRHYYDRTCNTYFIVVHSDTFDTVKEGKPIPLGVIAVHDIRPQQQNPPHQKENEVEKGAKEATAEKEANIRADA